MEYRKKYTRFWIIHLYHFKYFKFKSKWSVTFSFLNTAVVHCQRNESWQPAAEATKMNCIHFDGRSGSGCRAGFSPQFLFVTFLFSIELPHPFQFGIKYSSQLFHSRSNRCHTSWKTSAATKPLAQPKWTGHRCRSTAGIEIINIMWQIQAIDAMALARRRASGLTVEIVQLSNYWNP